MERKLKIKDEYLKLIIGIGYDYDGYEDDVLGLRCLIQEMCKYAEAALNEDDKKPIYENFYKGDCKKLNILMEEIDEK